MYFFIKFQEGRKRKSKKSGGSNLKSTIPVISTAARFSETSICHCLNVCVLEYPGTAFITASGTSGMHKRII